jgi:carbonic anhydrase
MITTTIEKQVITPAEALKKLREGNFRFMNELRMRRNLMQQVIETAEGQNPFAAILSCMDSRTSNELIFDLGIGDIFSIRIAGNVISENVLGSLEFACKVAGAKFIVILGHTCCGAIKGACDDVKLGNLSILLNKIKPAISAETTVVHNRTSSNNEFVEKVGKLNAILSIQELLQQSPILRDMSDNGEIGIISAMYHIETGAVDFYDETLILKK